MLKPKQALLTASTATMLAVSAEANSIDEDKLSPTLFQSSASSVIEQEKSLNNQPKGMLLNIEPNEASELGKEFLKSPQVFLKKFGLTFENSICPDEVHQAKDRADKFAEHIKQEFQDFSLNEQAVQKIQTIASQHFGETYEVEIIPYGLKFIEKQKIIDMAGTITGSGTVTFADGDSDVDG